jgi:CRP-like cAMP-binding protein
MHVGLGDVIGEMALFDDAPRSAGAIAATELACLRLPRRRPRDCRAASRP